MTAVVTGVATTAPVSMAPSADGRVYVVNGLTRGWVVVGGTTAHPIGVTQISSVAATTMTTPQYYYVSSIQVLEGGENYKIEPRVTIFNVTGERATLEGDAVASIVITSSNTNISYAPSVDIDATTSQASDASAYARLRGQVAAVKVQGNAYYASPPVISFAHSASAVTATRTAAAQGVLSYPSLSAASGKLVGAVITDPGIYEWNGSSLASGTFAVTCSVAAPLTGAATVSADISAAVIAVSASNTGAQYTVAPAVSFVPLGPTKRGDGAVAVANLTARSDAGLSASVNSVHAYDLISGGNGYEGRVEVKLTSAKAKAVAQLTPRLFGKFLCGVRLVDAYGLPGSMSDLVEVDCKDRASTIRWPLAGISLTDSSPNRIQKLELWRTSADQATTLYRVASLTSIPAYYDDELPDYLLTDTKRSGYGVLPILTEEGYSNAQRFGVPPQRMSVVALHQDRAWYAVDTTAASPNSIFFSAVGEYESVAAENEIVIEGSDTITGLMPWDGVLYVGQRTAIVRLTTAADPLASASAVPVAQRGMLNDRCWDTFEGTAYIADSHGVYAFTGSATEPLSDPISTYWTTPLIDFSKSQWFFLRVSNGERVVRFYFAPTGSGSAYPTSALCYSVITRAWWLEEYGVPLSCGVSAWRSNQQAELLGGSGKLYQQGVGLTDDGAAISYRLKTGNFPLNTDPKRGVRLLYSPTPTTHNLGIRLYYNNGATPRANAVSTDRGTGLVTTVGSTEAVLDMAATRSALADANGFAQASFSGRIDDRSVGGDRHVAVEIAGQQSSSKATIHQLSVEGAG